MGLLATKSVSFLLACLFNVGRVLCSNVSSTFKWVTASVTKRYTRFFGMDFPFFTESICMCLLRIWSTTVMTVNLSAPVTCPFLPTVAPKQLAELQNFSEPLTFQSPFDVLTEASGGNGELYLDMYCLQRSAALCSVRGAFWGQQLYGLHRFMAWLQLAWLWVSDGAVLADWLCECWGKGKG